MRLYKVLAGTMGHYGALWSSIELYGVLRGSMGDLWGSNGFLWGTMGLYGALWRSNGAL